MPDQEISAREWGRREAEKSPEWSEEKWRRIGAILGVIFIPVETTEHGHNPAA
jgi:hypothetical protein